MARKRTRSLTGPRKRKEKETAGSTTNKRKRAVGPTEAVVEEEPHRSERAEARREEVGVGVDADGVGAVSVGEDAGHRSIDQHTGEERITCTIEHLNRQYLCLMPGSGLYFTHLDHL